MLGIEGRARVMDGIWAVETAEQPVLAGWHPAPDVSESSLTGSTWTFGALGHQPYAPFLVLAPDGLIGNYRHDNEDLWQVAGGRLAFMSSHGVATTVFDHATTRDGRLTALRGRVRLPGATQFHELRRAAHPAHPLHPAAGDLDRRACFLHALPHPKRPNLVVLRAGDGSLHPAWPHDLPEDSRNWDLCISAYGQTVDGLSGPADYLTHQPHQRKFQAIHDLFFEDSPLWRYERVWFPDDDLMVSWADINLMFHIARKYSLDLVQPSLLRVPGCFITHSVTAQHPGRVLRYVDFVEIMCPAFSIRALRICLGTFRDSVSGFGLDHLWPALLGGARSRIAIIDATGVVHTRPLGQNYDVASAVAEEAALLKAYCLARVRLPALSVQL
jgi:hypothetical protein